MSVYDVNISTEAMKTVEGIVDDAFERMYNSAKMVGAQADQVQVGLQSTATGIAMDSFANLGNNARALGDALQGLKDDLNRTGEHGHETNQRAEDEIRRAAATTQSVQQGM